jgi:hypothetical protein
MLLSSYFSQFKAFIQCAMDNAEYYEPFLNMLFGEGHEDEEFNNEKPEEPLKLRDPGKA